MLKEKADKSLIVGDKSDEKLSKDFVSILQKYYDETGTMIKAIEVDSIELGGDGKIKARGVKIDVEENEEIEMPQEEMEVSKEETPIEELPSENTENNPQPESQPQEETKTESIYKAVIGELENGTSVETVKEQIKKILKIIEE